MNQTSTIESAVTATSQVPPATVASLVEDLKRLGVTAGRDMFVHSSLKSVGPVEGGAAGVVAAMHEALGPAGTLLMPSFNLVPGANVGRAKNWNIQTTPSTVGYLTEFFRSMPGSLRSDHFSHAVSAQGPKARWYTEGHLSLEGMESPWDMSPWGRAYGSQSPLIRAYDQDALLLMLGVDYHSSTYTHVVEVMDFNRRRKERPKASYFFTDRPMLGAWWDRHGDVSRGKVGQADCRLFSARKYVDTLCRLVASEPDYWFKWFEKSAY